MNTDFLKESFTMLAGSRGLRNRFQSVSICVHLWLNVFFRAMRQAGGRISTISASGRDQGSVKVLRRP